MRRILVVAHKTLGGRDLLAELRSRVEAGDCRIHLLVPVTHPMGAFSEASLRADAQKVLEAGMSRIRELDATGALEVTGEVGDANPVYAAKVTWNRGVHFDEVIVSTLAAGPSKWMRAGVPRQMARTFPVPVTHVVASAEPALT